MSFYSSVCFIQVQFTSTVKECLQRIKLTPFGNVLLVDLLRVLRDLLYQAIEKALTLEQKCYAFILLTACN